MGDEKKIVDGAETSVSDGINTVDRNAISGDSPNIQEVSPNLNGTDTTVDGGQPSKPVGDQASLDKPVEEEGGSETVSPEGDGDGEGWVDVLGNDQLRKKVLRAGQGEATRAERGMSVTVSYVGCLKSGAEVERHDKCTFTQGEGEVVQAVDLCVCLMELGEVAEICSNSRFAYGEYGKEPDIPPNADMVFEIEVLEVNPPPSPASMTLEECCQVADKKRQYGNDLFGRRDYSGAINSYTRALSFMEEAAGGDSSDQEGQVNDIFVKCYNNLAAAQLKVEAYSAALKSCNSALSRDPSNLKALFRKGKVLACQKEFTEAVTYLRKALAIEPTNKTIHQELAKLTAKQQKEVESEKAMYQRMVGDMASVSHTQQPSPPKKSLSAKLLLLGLAVAIAGVAIMLALQLS